jgi:hypothetical protein
VLRVILLRMDLSIAEARWILEGGKRLVAIQSWRAAENRHGCSVVHNFSARIQMEGTIPRGIWFRMSKILDNPNTGTFQLDCEQPGAHVHVPLYRLDWHPFRSHVNGEFGPLELRRLFIPACVTHEHNCLYHADEQTGLIRSGGVQTARIVTTDFGSFHESMHYVCDTLHIENAGEIPLPIAQGELL